MNSTKEISFFPWLVSLAVVLPVLWFVPFPMIARFAIIFIALIAYISKGGPFNLKTIYLIFLLICLLSIIFNIIPDKFKPWPRYVLFVIVLLLTSPLISTVAFNRFRVNSFRILLFLLSIITILSIFFYLAGINYMGNDDRGQAGATTQSMTMGPIAGITLIYAIYGFLQNLKKKGAFKYVYLILAAIAFIMVLLARSRTALVASVIGVFSIIIFLSGFRKGALNKALPGIIVIFICSIPLWNKYSGSIVEKNEVAIDNGSMTSSRDALWDYRIEEFKSKPIFGIGFSYIAKEPNYKNIPSPRFAHVNALNKHERSFFSAQSIEPGSSWLAVLSMTGIFGFVTFFIIYFSALKTVKILASINKPNPIYSLYAGILIFFGLHMIAEGYVLSAGNIMCYIFWLLLGTIYGQYYLDKKNLNNFEGSLRHSLSD